MAAVLDSRGYMTSRFFVPPEQIAHNRFTLLGSEARHAAVVLRKKPGDLIDLFDGKDLSYQGRIDAVSPERVEGLLLKETKGTSPAVELILCQALIKGPKWDWLLEKACEIGVSKMVPLVTARTVVKPSKGTAGERWKRIALAASKQSGRNHVMEIAAPQTLAEALKNLPKDTLAILPWEKETDNSIRHAMTSSPKVAIFVGPEGGWEAGEVELAVRHGAIPVRLGPTLLRSETAGLVASALVLAELGVYS